MKYSTLAWLVIASYTVFAQDGTSVTGYTTTIVIPGSPPAGAGTAHGGTENTGTVHTTEHLTGTEVTHTTGATPETTTIVAPTTTHENTTTHETSVENTATVHHNTTTLHHNTTTIHPNATGTETHTETGTGTKDQHLQQQLLLKPSHWLLVHLWDIWLPYCSYSCLNFINGLFFFNWRTPIRHFSFCS